MRAHEFIAENTVSGSIATVAMPMGEVITRTSTTKPTAKYTKTSMKRKPNVSRRFENSIGQ
jgi:hypothetical protein